MIFFLFTLRAPSAKSFVCVLSVFEFVFVFVFVFVDYLESAVLGVKSLFWSVFPSVFGFVFGLVFVSVFVFVFIFVKSP